MTILTRNSVWLQTNSPTRLCLWLQVQWNKNMERRRLNSSKSNILGLQHPEFLTMSSQWFVFPKNEEPSQKGPSGHRAGFRIRNLFVKCEYLNLAVFKEKPFSSSECTRKSRRHQNVAWRLANMIDSCWLYRCGAGIIAISSNSSIPYFNLSVLSIEWTNTIDR